MPENNAIDFFKMATHQMDKNNYIPTNSRSSNASTVHRESAWYCKTNGKLAVKDFK